MSSQRQFPSYLRDARAHENAELLGEKGYVMRDNEEERGNAPERSMANLLDLLEELDSV
jgi:hypothetical protein